MKEGLTYEALHGHVYGKVVSKKQPKTSKMGPKVPKKKVLHIRCSEEEWKLFNALASAAKRSLSDWIRLSLLKG